jgi:hypothetical protein
MPRWPSPWPEEARVPVSSSLLSVVRSHELVVGELSPAVLDALDGFEIVPSNDGINHLVARVDIQGLLCDIVTVVGAPNVHPVFLRPMIDEPI